MAEVPSKAQHLLGLDIDTEAAEGAHAEGVPSDGDSSDDYAEDMAQGAPPPLYTPRRPTLEEALIAIHQLVDEVTALKQRVHWLELMNKKEKKRSAAPRGSKNVRPRANKPKSLRVPSVVSNVDVRLAVDPDGPRGGGTAAAPPLVNLTVPERAIVNPRGEGGGAGGGDRGRDRDPHHINSEMADEDDATEIGGHGNYLY